MGNIFVNPEREDFSTQAQEMATSIREEEPEEEGLLAPEGNMLESEVESAVEKDEKEEQVGGAIDEQVGEGPEEDVGGARMKDLHLHCCLGGHESTLLGYRSRLYRSIAQAGLRGRIDVIMFGHVMYELLSGRELEGACPEEAEFEKVNDKAARDVLRRIFDLNSEPSMQEVSD